MKVGSSESIFVKMDNKREIEKETNREGRKIKDRREK